MKYETGILFIEVVVMMYVFKFKEENTWLQLGCARTVAWYVIFSYTFKDTHHLRSAHGRGVGCKTVKKYLTLVMSYSLKTSVKETLLETPIGQHLLNS